MWFQDIDSSYLVTNAALMKQHGITHAIWSLGTWREGETPNYEYWHTPTVEAVNALHAQGIKCIAHFMNTWPGAPAPVNVDNAAYNTARINTATALVNTYGFDGFASADESWTGSEANFISYNNQFHASFHALGKEYWFINMCYEGMGWSVSNVYGNIIADYLLPELYDGIGCQDLGFWLPSFNTCLSVAQTPVVVGVCAGRGTGEDNYGLDLAYVLNQLQANTQTLDATQKANLVGIDVYGASADSPDGTDPMFMWDEDWTALDAYLGEVSTFTLTINSATGGTTDPVAGVTEHDPNEEITLSAYPNEGNWFRYWIINEINVYNNPYSFNINSDTIVTPVFNTPTISTDNIILNATIIIANDAINNDDVVSLQVHCGATKEVSSFTLTLNNNDGLYGEKYGGTYIAEGDSIQISIGRSINYLLFTGTVEDVNPVRQQMNRTLTVTGRCLGKQLFNKLVTGKFINTTPHALIIYLIENYTSLSHVRNSVELIETAYNTIGEVEYNEKPVFDILTDIAGATVSGSGVIGYTFRIASDGKFEFFPTGTKTNSSTLNDNNIETVKPESKSSRIRNKIRVYGTADKSIPLDKDTYTEALSGTGFAWSVGAGESVTLDTNVKFKGNTSIRLSAGTNYYGMACLFLNSGYYVNANLYPEITFQARYGDNFSGNYAIRLIDVNDNEATVFNSVSACDRFVACSAKCGEANAENWGIWPFDATFDWTQIKRVDIQFDCSTPKAGDHYFYIDQLYFGGRRYYAEGTVATIEVRELAETDDNLQSDADCQARVDALLAFYKDPAESLTLETTIFECSGTLPIAGDMIPINLATEGINASYLLDSVEYTLDGENKELNVEFTAGKPQLQLADYIYKLTAKTNQLSNSAKGGGGGVVSGGGSNVIHIDGTQIVDATITGAKIADATITGENIANATITAADIANGTITAIQIANGTITATQIQNLTITASQIANNTITATQIQNQTITATQIANSTITSAQISGTAQITGGQIAQGTITAGNLTDLTVTAGKIANLTITASQIANLTITGGSNGNIATSTITRDNIVAGTITALEIAAETITGDKIAVNTITANNIAANVAILNKIWADTVTGKTLQTASSGDRVVINSLGINSYGESANFYDINGNWCGLIYGQADPRSIVIYSGNYNITLITLSQTVTINSYTNITASQLQSWDNDYFYATYGTHGDLTNNSGTVAVGLRVTSRIVCESEIDAFSDRRLKNLVARLNPEKALKAINNLSPLQYRWKPELNKGNKLTAGFFAQEVGPVIPEAVYTINGKHYPDEHYLTYDVLHAYEVAAIQQLSKEIKELRKSVNL